MNEKKTPDPVSETIRLLAGRFGLEATVVDGVVRVTVPDHATKESVLKAVSDVAADVNNKFGTSAFVQHREVPREDPPVTAAVTPEPKPEPVYTGKLAKVPPMFLEIIAKSILGVCGEVSVEAMSATDKHGLFVSPHEGWAVIKEELDELFDEIRANVGKKAGARHEAIQVAATAVKYVLMLGPPFGAERIPEKHHKVAIDIAKYTN